MPFKKNIFYFIFTSILLLFSIQSTAQQQPIPDWVKDIGGTGEAKLSGIAVDKFDNVYVCGNFQGTLTVDLSGVSSPVSLTSNGSYDVFVAKYTFDGKLIWAKSIGGNALEQSNNLAVDKDGNVIVGGSFGSSYMDFDPGAGVSTISNVGGDDAFIFKLTTDGNFLWARSVASSGTERGHVVTSDNLGNVIFVGAFNGTINLEGQTLTNVGNLDGFIVKYSATGTVLWGYGFGSSGTDEIKSVKTDTNNEIVIMGYFANSVDINPKGPSNIITGGATAYFLAKYTEDGLLKWVNKIDGSGTQTMASIAIGPTDDIFITGVYNNQINFNSPSNTISLTNPGKNLVVAKYNSSGTTNWVRNIAANGSNPYSYYITADVDNNTYIGGYFDNTLTFTDGTNSKSITYSGTKDTFFGKFSGTGDFLWAFNFGSNCTGNYGHKIAVDSKKNVLLGGAFCQTVDFNPGSCNYILTSKNSTSDGFISKYNQIKFTGDALITNFELTDQASPAIIDNISKTIKIKVKAGTDITTLKPKIATDIGTIYPLSETIVDFTSPKTYTITSNCLTYPWTVEVIKELSPPEVCSGKTITIYGSVIFDQNATYQWEINDNGNWINAPAQSTDKDYIYVEINNSGNSKTIDLRRRTLINSIGNYDSQQSITLLPNTTNNIISTLTSKICNGKANINIDGTIPSGAENTTITYKWQHSYNEIDWIEVIGAVGKDFIPNEFTQTTFFRRITYADACESLSNELKIEVYPELTIANAGENISLCGTNTTTLNANAVNNTSETGVWSVISAVGYNPFDVSNVNNPLATIQNIPENTDIVLQWTINQNNCGTESTSQIHVFNYGKPTVNFPPFITINENQSLPIPSSITGAPNVNYTYHWSPANFLDDPALLAPIVSPEETSIYKLTVSYGTCSIDKEIKIIVNKAKRISMCGGNAILLVGAVDHDSQSVYQWQELIAGVWTDINNANSETYNLSVTKNFGNNPEDREYRRKVVNAPYYDSRYIITVAPTTTNNVISTAQTKFCQTEVQNLSIMGTVPTGASSATITYKWQQSADGLAWQDLNETQQDLTVGTITQTTYFRRITYADACESLSNELKIEVYPELTIANAGENISMCATNTTTLNANAVNNTSETGVWSVISPVGYNPFDASNVNNPLAKIQNIPENTDIVLQWTINQNNCGTESTSQIHVINYGKPTVNLPPFITINENQSLPIPSSITGAPNVNYTYQWSPADFLDDPALLSPTVSPEETSIYKLTVSYGSCSLNKDIKIIVNKAKRISMCGGNAILLVGAVDHDSQSVYQWQELIAGVWTDINNANSETYNLSVTKNFGNSPEDREYRRKVVNAPYYDSRYIITVAPTTNINVISTAQTKFCQTEMQNLSIMGTVPTGASSATITYKWQQSADGLAWQNLNETQQDLTVGTITQTTYFRRITFADECESLSNELKIEIFESPTVSYAGNDVSLCNVTSYTLNASEVKNNEIGTWFVTSPSNYQPFDVISMHNPKATIINLPFNEPINLKWSINNYNCGVLSSSDFTLISYKDITIIGVKEYTINLSNKIQIGVTTDLSPEISYSIDWNPKIGLNRYDILNPIASPRENTKYTATINYGENCFKTFSTDIIVLKKLDIPSAFSPNDDGVNDKWEIKNLSDYRGSMVTVYNRYGAIVYQTFTNGTWDGTHKGKRLPAGVYYYVINLNNEEKSVFSGSLTLLQ